MRGGVQLGPEDPRALGSAECPRNLGLGLAAQNPVEVMPAVADPAEVQVPLLAIPVDAGDAPGAIGVLLVREDEDHLAPERGGDLALVLEEMLAIVLPEVGAQLLGLGRP